MATSSPQRISLGAFGVQFVRQILHPARIAGQINRQLPKPTTGTVALTDAGIGTASYTVRVETAYAQPGPKIGLLRITLSMEVVLTLKLVVSKTFRFRTFVPFWLEFMAYRPLVLFINTSEVNASEIQFAPIDPITGAVTMKIWELVQQQMRPMVVIEVNKALRESYPTRIMDLRPADAQAEAVAGALRSMDASWTSSFADEVPADLLPDPEAAPTVFSETDDTPADLPADLIWRPEIPPVVFADVVRAQAAPERMSYEQFGAALLYFLASPAVVARELNAAIAKSPLKPEISTGFNLSIAVPTVGKATVQYLGQNIDEQGLLAVIPITVLVQVWIGNIWREGWQVHIQAPIQLRVRTYDGPLLVFLAADAVTPASLQISNIPLSNTGIAWGSVESTLREKICEAINSSLGKSAQDRTKNVEAEARKMLKE